MLEEKLKKLGKKNLEVHLIYKNNLNGIVAIMVWHDPNHCYTLRSDRLISFEDLYTPPASCNTTNAFEFNLVHILGDMATKILRNAEQYPYLKGENNND